VAENRSTGKSGSEQVLDQPIRRKFSPEYKLRILQEIDNSRDERGAVGKILRREGLFASQVASWRRSLEEVIAHGFPERKRGRKRDPAAVLRQEKQKLERKYAKAMEENRQLKLILEAQKKIAEMYPDKQVEPKSENEE
jgi:transposase-like protein